MVDIDELRKSINKLGITMTALASNSGMERGTLYNRLNGIGEFTASEISGISNALRLTKQQRDSIFFADELTDRQY